MFVMTIHFNETLYYRLTFCFIKCLMLKFIIKKKLSEKSHSLYREGLRVGSDTMTQR